MDEQNILRGERVREIRKLRGLTQGELADHIGVSRPQFSNLERGATDTSLRSLVCLAQALGCTTDYLLGLSDSPFANIQTNSHVYEALHNVGSAVVNVQDMVNELMRRMSE